MSIKSKETIFTVWCFIREQYETKYKKINFPDALKCLIVSYTKYIIESELLTIQEDVNFVQLLESKILSQLQQHNEYIKIIETKTNYHLLPKAPYWSSYRIVNEANKPRGIKQFNLLYRASDHDFSSSKFIELCNRRKRMLLIIKNNYGDIFGTYLCCGFVWSHKSMPPCLYSFQFLIRSSDTEQQKHCPMICRDLSKSTVQFIVLPCNLRVGKWFGPPYRWRQKDNEEFQSDNDISENEDIDIEKFLTTSPPPPPQFDTFKYPVPRVLAWNFDSFYQHLFEVIEYEMFEIV